MFNMDSQPTISELVVKSADSAVESDDYMADFTADPLKIGVWVCAFRLWCWNVPILTPILILIVHKLAYGPDYTFKPHTH